MNPPYYWSNYSTSCVSLIILVVIGRMTAKKVKVMSSLSGCQMLNLILHLLSALHSHTKRTKIRWMRTSEQPLGYYTSWLACFHDISGPKWAVFLTGLWIFWITPGMIWLQGWWYLEESPKEAPKSWMKLDPVRCPPTTRGSQQRETRVMRGMWENHKLAQIHAWKNANRMTTKVNESLRSQIQKGCQSWDKSTCILLMLCLS